MFSFRPSLKPSEWMADDSSPTCLLCGDAFNAIVRRHHCRKCLKLVCDSCSLSRVALTRGALERVCDACVSADNDVAAVDTIAYTLILHEAKLQTSAMDATRKFYFNVCLSEKVVYSSEAHSSTELNWSTEAIELKVSPRTPLYVHVEMWERGGKSLLADELVGKCRVLVVCGGTSSFTWYPLLPGAGNYAGANKVWVSTHLDAESSESLHLFYLRYRSRLAQVHVPSPLGASTRIGFGAEFRCTFLLPFASLFKQGTTLFQSLFTFFNKDRRSRRPSQIDTITRTYEDLARKPVHLGVLPYNEILLEALDRVSFIPVNDRRAIEGVLFLTTHRLVFLSSLKGSGDSPDETDILAVNLWLADASSSSIRRSERNTKFEVMTKADFVFKFKVARSKEDDSYVQDVFLRMKSELHWAGLEDNFSCMFRSIHTLNLASKEETFISEQMRDGATLREYSRLGVDAASGYFRVTEVNLAHELCDTYPSSLAVPDSISDELLKVASSQRANKRLPALTWLHRNGSALFRSSQPLSGGMASNTEDEMLVLALRESCLLRRKEDCDEQVEKTSNPRGSPSPMTESAQASGLEDAIAWPSEQFARLKSLSRGVGLVRKNSVTLATKRITRGMYNIFNSSNEVADDVSEESEVVADPEECTKDTGEASKCKLRIVDARSNISASANVLKGAGFESVARLGGSECATIKFASIANIHYVRDSLRALRNVCCSADKSQYHYRISDSKWLHYISDLLSAAVYIAQMLEGAEPVLLHCSDGWDRTAQLACLSQVLLDPFYRTAAGLKELIQKDFVDFGHKFGTRSIGDANEISPIFLQFLDALWQCWTQFPNEFEFGENLLVLLFEACSSRFTCDFLMNVQERRRVLGLFSVQTQDSCAVCNSLDGERLVNIAAVDPSTGDDREVMKSNTCTCDFGATASPCCLISVWDIIFGNPELYANKLFAPTRRVDCSNIQSVKCQDGEDYTLQGSACPIEERRQYLEPSFAMNSLRLWSPVHYSGLPLRNLGRLTKPADSAYLVALDARILKCEAMQREIDYLKLKLAEQISSTNSASRVQSEGVDASVNGTLLAVTNDEYVGAAEHSESPVVEASARAVALSGPRGTGLPTPTKPKRSSAGGSAVKVLSSENKSEHHTALF